MATVKITNTLTKVIGAGEGRPTFISPSGVTVPCTPIQEYISDMVTIDDGTLYIPAYNKVQMLQIPYGAFTQFEVTDAKELNYWENIKVDGAKVEVTLGENEGLQPVLKYVFTKVTIVDKGESADPRYVPEFKADTYYAPAEGGGEPAQDATAIADNTGWGTDVTVVYTRANNVLPTNDVPASNSAGTDDSLDEEDDGNG